MSKYGRKIVYAVFVVSLLSYPEVAEGRSWCVYPDIPLACLNEVSDDELGSRVPLILIHGWNKDSIPGEPMWDTWDKFRDDVNRDASLNRTFKTYTFTYYSNVTEIESLAVALRDILQLYYESDPSFRPKRIAIVAHSMGGLVARAFLHLRRFDGDFADSLWGENAAVLVTLATPHHGSPLANDPAIAAKLDAISTQIWNLANDLFYLTFSPKWDELNRSELRWDNFDGKLDYENPAYAGERNEFLENLNADTRFDSKVVAYGGFFDTCNMALHLLTCSVNTVISNVFGVTSDGVVPISSSLFYTTSENSKSRFRTRYLPDYNHTEMATGKGDGVLFARIKQDLLEAVGIPLTTIGGRVYDAANPRLLSGVTVEVVGMGLRTVTDANGNYRLDGINLTTFTVRYSHPNYRTIERVYTFQPGSENLNIDVGLNPNGTASQYDGSWAGRGTGTSSASTAASVDITFQVSNNTISSLTFQWKINTPPGTEQSAYCGGTGKVNDIRINNNSFTTTTSNGSNYSTKIIGTFTSTNTITGTAEFIRQSGAQPWCVSATLNWSGKKQ